MYKRINSLLEICNIIFLLHCFRGKKVKIDIYAMVLILINMIIFELVHSYKVDEIVVNIIYLLIAVYTMEVFGKDKRELILSNMLYFIVLGTIQSAVGICILLFRFSFLEGDALAITVNVSTFLIVYLCRAFWKKFFDKVLIYDKGIEVVIVLYFCFMIQNLMLYKKDASFSLGQLIIIVTLGFLVCGISYSLQSEKEKRHEKELELQMNQLYGDSFKELIETIREKQHDFNNHIQAIKSQHYTIHTYDELVREQEKYCDILIDDSKYYRLLNKDNPIITGFLYGKFIEADRQGIQIDYSIELDESNENIPIHILVEIIGILWDNAVEFVKDKEEKCIKILLEKYMGHMKIEVSNPVHNISYVKIGQLFEKGYTEKKNHSGIGLHKIKKYAEKFGFLLMPDKKKIGDKYWLTITLDNCLR